MRGPCTACQLRLGGGDLMGGGAPGHCDGRQTKACMESWKAAIASYGALGGGLKAGVAGCWLSDSLLSRSRFQLMCLVACCRGFRSVARAWSRQESGGVSAILIRSRRPLVDTPS